MILGDRASFRLCHLRWAEITLAAYRSTEEPSVRDGGTYQRQRCVSFSLCSIFTLAAATFQINLRVKIIDADHQKLLARSIDPDTRIHSAKFLRADGISVLLVRRSSSFIASALELRIFQFSRTEAEENAPQVHEVTRNLALRHRAACLR